MCLDIFKQLVCGKELRVAAYYFQVVIGVVREINEVLDYIKQSVFTEQPFYHRNKGIKTVKLLIVGVYLSPSVEKVIRAEKRTVLVIRSIAYYDKSVVFEYLRYVSAITNRKLLVRIHYRGIFFYGALKFKDYNRNTIHEHNAVGNTQLIIDPLNLELINRFENIVFGSVKINQLYIKVFLGSVLTVEKGTV